MIYESEYAWAVISPDLIKEMQCQNMHLTDVDRNCVIDSIGYAKEKLNFKINIAVLLIHPFFSIVSRIWYSP